MKKFLIVFIAIMLTACSNMQVAELDPVTGRFPTKQEATVVISKSLDLDQNKQLLLLPDNEFFKGQINNINYFDQAITMDELETEVIRNNLTDKIPSVRDKIGINKAYREYKPFLWLRLDVEDRGANSYVQLILTNPDTLEDLFMAERYLDYVWAGVNDQQTWYPLFNALVDFISQNSNSWNKAATPTASVAPSSGAKASVVAKFPAGKSDGIPTQYPELVERLYSQNANVVQQAAKQIGEEKLFSDGGLVYASKSVLEAALLANNIDKKDKYRVDALAWCALNIGSSKDQEGKVLLSDVAASDLPKKVRNHAIHALKTELETQ